MANKRIKISELPKVTYNPVAGALDSTLSDENYLPIAITDRNNAAIKTTMAVTTRELKRYIYDQPQDFEDNTNELTIARSGITVKTSSLSATNITMQVAVINTLTVTNFSTTTFQVDGDITVGSSTYPAIVRRPGQQSGEANLILVSGPAGVMSSTPGKSLAEFIANNPVTSSANNNTVVTVGPLGELAFGNSIRTLLRGANSVESDPVNNGGEILAVGANGSMVPASTLNAKYSTVNIDNTFNAIESCGKTFKSATETDQKILVTTSSTPTLSGDGTDSDIQVASANHMKLVTTIDSDNDAVNFSNTSETRIIASSPLVLAAKFENGQDLTVNSISKDIPAQIGELRWNVYNGVPTLYMAVSADQATPDRVANSKIWYGVPLFGDLSTASITGNVDIP